MNHEAILTIIGDLYAAMTAGQANQNKLQHQIHAQAEEIERLRAATAEPPRSPAPTDAGADLGAGHPAVADPEPPGAPASADTEAQPEQDRGEPQP